MTRPVITSLANPLVRQVRALRTRKGRAEAGLFVVEGIHHVGEAVEAGWQIDWILYASELLASGFAKSLIERHAPKLQLVSGAVMQSLADKENPQGILAIVHQRHPALSDLPAVRRSVAMVTPQDPGNVGTVLRSMDAVGADVLMLVDGGADPYHPTCVRASMGTIFWKPVTQAAFPDLIAWAKAKGIQLVGTSAHANTDYRAFIPVQPWLLLLGNEQKGLNPDQLKYCDVALSLPMRGRASSLNVAVTAGILLYQFSL